MDRPLQRIAGAGFALMFLFLLPASSTAQGTLFVEGDRVGVGTPTPGARLDIQPVSGTPLELRIKNDATSNDIIFVEQSGTTGGIFRVFEAPTGEGVFSVFNASGGENLRFTGQAGGRLGIGCASGISHDLVLNATGGGDCGTGTRSTINAGATQFTVSSSRTIKQNIVPFEVHDILDKISTVDVYNYDFIAGPENSIGLMAEDFHNIFGRGSDKLLDGQEVTMALWLAVRELIAQNKELSAKLAMLDQKMAGTAGASPLPTSREALSLAPQ